MFEIIAIIAIVLAIAIAIILIVAATKPNAFSLQRATIVKAPPERIFPLINDFHQWGAWSPYENKDPAMKRSYSGAASGQGAIYAWEGNKNVGSGRMEILQATAPSKIVIKLDTVRGPQHRRVHNAAAGRCYQCDMAHAWPVTVHGQGHACVHQHGPHGRQGF
jgi:hypothetical protein